MATARRMPTNIDVLDALTERVAQEGNTTVINGNLKVNGNINLYRHVIHATTEGAEFMISVISSNNIKVNSVAALKTLLGNTFEYPATGYYENNTTAIWKINQNGATDVDYPCPTTISLTDFTFTDTVTVV